MFLSVISFWIWVTYCTCIKFLFNYFQWSDIIGVQFSLIKTKSLGRFICFLLSLHNLISWFKITSLFFFFFSFFKFVFSYLSIISLAVFDIFDSFWNSIMVINKFFEQIFLLQILKEKLFLSILITNSKKVVNLSYHNKVIQNYYI